MNVSSPSTLGEGGGRAFAVAKALRVTKTRAREGPHLNPLPAYRERRRKDYGFGSTSVCLDKSAFFHSFSIVPRSAGRIVIFDSGLMLPRYFPSAVK